MELYVSDLDGTLLNSSRKLSAYSIRIINEIIKKGHYFIIATSRSRTSAEPIIGSLNLKLPVIFHNGVFVFDPQSGKNIVSQFLSRQQSSAILDFFLMKGLAPFIYTRNKNNENHVYYTGIHNKGEEVYFNYRMKNRDSRFRLVESYSNALEEDIICFVVKHIPDLLDPVYEYLRSSFHVDIHYAEDIYTPGFYWLEIHNKLATKAHAVQFVKEYVGADKLICMGDHINDLTMFSIADESYAVENAHEEIKKKATAVIQSNNQNGVARFLESRLIKNRADTGLTSFSNFQEASLFIKKCADDNNPDLLFGSIKENISQSGDIVYKKNNFQRTVFPAVKTLFRNNEIMDHYKKTAFPKTGKSFRINDSTKQSDILSISFVKQNKVWLIEKITKTP